MKPPGQTLERPRGRLLTAAVVLKKLRTKIAILVVVICVAEWILRRHPPLPPISLHYSVLLGYVLIAAGLALRIGALGAIHKKDAEITQTGVYSLCRHPLYLGSVLLAFGFCGMIAHLEDYLVAAGYFLVFLPLTIIWEEVRLSQRYGESHANYARTVPLLLPLGRFRRGAFSWKQAARSGGLLLILLVIASLAGLQIMAVRL